MLISADCEEHDAVPGTVRSAAGRWKTHEWVAKQTRNILNLVTEVENSSVVERKNKMKKTIKKKEEDEEEEEANKSPSDHIYSDNCWRVYQDAAVQSVLNIFFV